MLSNIEAERGRAGLSKTAIASDLEISTTTYGKYIEEIWPIPSTVLVKMSLLFHCPVDYLLGLDTAPAPRNPGA